MLLILLGGIIANRRLKRLGACHEDFSTFHLWGGLQQWRVSSTEEKMKRGVIEREYPLTEGYP